MPFCEISQRFLQTVGSQLGSSNKLGTSCYCTCCFRRQDYSKSLGYNWKFMCGQLKEALSVSMICVLVFIFISGSLALLGCPCPGLWIWLLLLAIFNTLFWVYVNLFHKKTDKTWKYSNSAIFVWHKNGCQQLLGAQSINTERVSLNMWTSYLSCCFEPSTHPTFVPTKG